MPLSDDEERRLAQMARTLYEQDPASAERIAQTTLARYLGRNCWWAALGLLGGLVIVVVGFSSSWLLGVVGFAVMTACAVVLTHNLRRIGRHGWRHLTDTVRDWSAGGTDRRPRRRPDGDGPP